MTTPTKPPAEESVAVALAYEAGRDRAPRIVAHGRDAVARRILAVAAESGVPLHQDADLAFVLSRLEIGMTIPVEVFSVVAEILACVYRAGRPPVAEPVRPSSQETL